MLDPSDSAIREINEPDAPSDCSRWKGTWYFNSHVYGALDGESEPVCKATSGKTTCAYLYDLKIYIYV